MAFTDGAFLGFVDAHLGIMSLLKWLDIIGILLLTGLFAFWLFVLKPGLKKLYERDSKPELEFQVQRYLNRLWGVGLLFLTLTTFLSIPAKAFLMSRGVGGYPWDLMSTLLFHTYIGYVAIFKIVLLAGLGFLWFFPPLKWRSKIALGLGLLLCLSTTLTGHSMDGGGFSFILVAATLHVIAVSIWIGGVVHLFFFARPALKKLDQVQAHKLLTFMVARFSKIAIPCVTLIIATGVYAAVFRITDLDTLFKTPYGATVLFKLGFVGLAVGVGGLSKFHILPCLKRFLRDHGENGLPALKIRQRFFAFIGAEVIFSVIILTCASLLTQTPPPVWFVMK